MLRRKKGQMNNSTNIAYVAKRLLAVAFVIAFLQVSTATLIAYIAGTGITPEQTGAVATFSVATLIFGTLFSTVVHFFIFAVATFIGVVLVGLVRGSRKNDPNAVGVPTPTAGADDAFKAFAKKFAIIVLSIATCLSAWQATGVYVGLSLASPAAGLIVLATMMTFGISLIYSTVVVGFIGVVGCVIVTALIALRGGRSSAK